MPNKTTLLLILRCNICGEVLQEELDFTPGDPLLDINLAIEETLSFNLWQQENSEYFCQDCQEKL